MNLSNLNKASVLKKKYDTLENIIDLIKSNGLDKEIMVITRVKSPNTGYYEHEEATIVDENAIYSVKKCLEHQLSLIKNEIESL